MSAGGERRVLQPYFAATQPIVRSCRRAEAEATTSFDHGAGRTSILCVLVDVAFFGLHSSGRLTAEVDAIEEHRERSAVERDARRAVRNVRHLEAASLKAHVIDNESASREEQDLHAIASPTKKHEERPRVRVRVPSRTNERDEPIVTATEIDGLGCEHDARADAQAQHPRTSSATTAASCSAESVQVPRTETRPREVSRIVATSTSRSSARGACEFPPPPLQVLHRDAIAPRDQGSVSRILELRDPLCPPSCVMSCHARTRPRALRQRTALTL